MNPILEELIRTGVSPTPTGGSVKLQSHVLADEAELLTRVVRELKPRASLEIGLAMGCSALAICDALAGQQQARHIVMDPRQHAQPLWGGIGLHNLARAGFTPLIDFLELPSHRGLAQLEAEGRRVQFAFIDGFHTFDFALVDFFLIDRLLDVGGMVAFDDADWPSVKRVVRYVATNRSYSVHAALSPRRGLWSTAKHVYEGTRTVAGAMLGAAAKLPAVGRVVAAAFTPDWRGTDARLGLGGPCVVLRKTAEDTRRYDHHVDF